MYDAIVIYVNHFFFVGSKLHCIYTNSLAFLCQI